jgi:hypothetical protein
MKASYVEGPKALANFERFARSVFQAPKPAMNPKKQRSKPATLRKSKRSDKD